jgi:hypothetical protein
MITFLTDLELYRKESDDCPRCAQAKAEMSHVRERLDRLIENCARVAKRLDLEPCVRGSTPFPGRRPRRR